MPWGHVSVAFNVRSLRLGFGVIMKTYTLLVQVEFLRAADDANMMAEHETRVWASQSRGKSLTARNELRGHIIERWCTL